MEWHKRDHIRAYAYHVQGQAKHNANHYHEAITYYDKAIQLNSETLYTYYKRGNAKDALGDYEGAIADFDKAIQLNPEEFDIYRERGSSEIHAW